MQAIRRVISLSISELFGQFDDQVSRRRKTA